MRAHIHRFALPVLILGTPLGVGAQGEIRGRVLTDSGRSPVAAAELKLLALTITATSDSTGRFVLSGIPKGDHLLVVRAVGFSADTSDVAFSSNETLL